jgi:carboxypeptidase D
MAADCKYTGYVEKYVTYPPNGLLPLPGTSVEADEGCDVWDEIFNASLIVNPAFNLYRIFDTVSASPSSKTRVAYFLPFHSQYPILWDVLGFPYETSFPVKISIDITTFL